MRRIAGSLLVLFISSVAVAANGLRHEVRVAVEKALANEREAIARYEAYAAKAVEEGYPGAAALFRAAARGESAHARRFEKVLRANGEEVPTHAAATPAAGDTGDNLRMAASHEAAERDGLYKEAAEKCRTHGAADLAAIFEETRDAEVEHGNLCMAAARGIDSMKSGKTYYVCDACGYVTDVRLPLCPSCRKRDGLEEVR